MNISDIIMGVICYILLDEWVEKKQIKLKIKAFLNKVKSRIK